MRKLIAIVTGLILLGAVNVIIYQREQLLSHGRTVLLELAPVDPRSLMQGDYMALRFKMATAVVQNDEINKQENDGLLVIALDERGIGSFKRLADANPLAANEALLQYHTRNGQLKFATNAFFFEEGSAEQFQTAKYGEFRVAEDGDMLLTAMRDNTLKVLGGKP